MVFTQELTSKFGAIWAKRPLVRSNGLICSIANRRHRKARPRPVFKAVAFSLNGEMVATLDGRGHVVVFHLLRNRYEHLRHIGAAGSAIAFSSRRKNELFIQVFDVESKQMVAVLKGHRHPVNSITLNSTGTLLATSSVDAAIIWSTGNWTRRRTLGCGSGVLKAMFLPSAELLAAGFLDDTILVWDSVTYDVVARLSLPEREGRVALTCFDVSLDGRYLIAGAKSGSCYLWEVRSQTLVRIADMPSQVQKVLDVKFLPNGQVAAILGDDGHIIFASVAGTDCKSLLDISVNERALLCFAMDPAGRYLASSVSDGHLLLHDVQAARKQRAIIRAAQKRMGIPSDELDAILETRPTSGRKLGPARPTLGPSPYGRASQAHPGSWRQPVGGAAATVNVVEPDAHGAAVGAGAGAGAGLGAGEPPTSMTALDRARKGIERTGMGDPGVLGHPYFDDPAEGPAAAAAAATTGTGRGGDGAGATGAGRPRATGGGGVPPAALAAAGDRAAALQRLGAGGKRVAWGAGVGGGTAGDDDPAVVDESKPVTSKLLERVFPVKGSHGAVADPGHEALPTAGGGAGIRRRRKQVASMRAEARRDAELPLYRVAELHGEEVRVNEKRLHSLLQTYGEFPAKYRLLVWRFLLRLPENRAAFHNLTGKGVHPAFADLHKRYPISDTRLFRRLRRILSAMAYWSPVFGELSYLPALAFPFVKMFGRDDLAAFETVMSLVLNWGSGWLETFPHAPLQVMGQVDALVAHHEPELARHLHNCGVDAQDFGWTLMRSVFTEVLAKHEWLRLWDHLVMSAAQPTTLLFAVVAYLRYFKTTLLHIKSPTEGSRAGPDLARQQILAFLRHQNAIDMTKFLRFMRMVAKTTPRDMIPAPEWPGEPAASAVAEGSGAVFPIPRGESYPAFLHFPKFVVDFQLQERERIRLEEEELSRKNRLVESLREKTEALEREEVTWRNDRARLVAAEEERKRRAEELRERREREARRLDAEARERRLEQIARMQDATRAAIAKQRAEAEVQAERTQEELRRQMAHEEQTMRARLEEEALLNLEFQAHQRMVELKSQREREEAAARMERDLDARRKAAELDQKLLNDAWRTEDEERRVKRRLLEVEKDKRLKAEIASTARRNQEAQHLLASLEREAALGAVARQRRLRHIAEDEFVRAESAQEARDREAAVLAREEEQAMRQLLLEETRKREADSARRLAVLEEARRQAALEEELREKRRKQLEAIQNRREFEEQVLKKRQADLEAARKEEERVQASLVSIDEQRRQARENELQRLMIEQERKERSMFVDQVRAANAKVIARERALFDEQRLRADTNATAVEEAMEAFASRDRRGLAAGGGRASGSGVVGDGMRVAEVYTSGRGPGSGLPGPGPAAARTPAPRPAAPPAALGAGGGPGQRPSATGAGPAGSRPRPVTGADVGATGRAVDAEALRLALAAIKERQRQEDLDRAAGRSPGHTGSGGSAGTPLTGSSRTGTSYTGSELTPSTTSSGYTKGSGGSGGSFTPSQRSSAHSSSESSYYSEDGRSGSSGTPASGYGSHSRGEDGRTPLSDREGVPRYPTVEEEEESELQEESRVGGSHDPDGGEGEDARGAGAGRVDA